MQEALTNVLKHAGATRITVTTEIDEATGRALIIVADDGHGFAPEVERGNRPPGRGLENMRRRAEAVGGAIAIDSGPQGTRITLGLPMQ